MAIKRISPQSTLKAIGLLALIASYLAATAYPFNWMINHAEIRAGVAMFPEPGVLTWNGAESWIELSVHKGS